MKKLSLLIITVLISASASFAQKYGFVDTEYILNNIPSYTAAQEKLDGLSEGWEKEISDAYAEVEKMYKQYQNDVVLLSKDAKVKREEAIIEKERQAKELQNTYFGVEGELYKKREELIQPIQDEIYKAVKELAVEGGYAVIFDTSSGMNMLYTNPKYDVSDEILEKLGYKN
ncbi:MAG: OmpH family outer membrane protein [Marinilabiliaceae bacterium]|jgi:outer membrane protein|nr:OmpH family outer membrane protein [Marinilabiliaceae bacterium]